VASQVVTLAAIPFLTRVYPPEIFAVLATLMAVSVIFGLVAPLGFDFAVPVVREHNVAVSLAAGGIIVTGVVALCVAVTASIIPAEMTKMLLGASFTDRSPWLVGVPVALTAWGTILEALQVRRRAFSNIGIARLLQAIAGVATQIGLGLNGWGASGLILGYILMLLVPCVFHSISLRLVNKNVGVEWGQITRHLKRHRHFAQFTAPEAFFNAVAVHGPILLLGLGNVASAVIAYLNLSSRLLQAPSYLIAKTGSQIIQGSMHEWERQGELDLRIKKIAMRYAQGGLLVGAIVAALAPFCAGLILGESWDQAGWVISLLVPSVVLYMVSFPLISIGYLKNRNKEMLLLTFGSAMLRLILCALALPHGDAMILFAFTGGAVAQYAFLTLYMISLARK
jgi:O-antigen/teichoic acid export membrane protein